MSVSVSPFTTSPCGPLSDKTCYVAHHDWLSPEKHTVTDYSFVTNDKTTSHVLHTWRGPLPTWPRGHRLEHTCPTHSLAAIIATTCHFNERGGVFQFRRFLRFWMEGLATVSLACQGFRNPGQVVVSNDDMWIDWNILSVSDKKWKFTYRTLNKL